MVAQCIIYFVGEDAEQATFSIPFSNWEDADKYRTDAYGGHAYIFSLAVIVDSDELEFEYNR